MGKTLTLMVTDACNCDCRYCYQKILRQRRIGNLSVDIIEKLDEILGDFESIQFFGGEPLMAEEFIFDLDRHIDVLVNKKQLVSKPQYVFSTNLVVLNKRLKNFLYKLKEEGTVFKFIITVDGTRLVHDKNRVLNNGKGTYNKILKNYQFLIENNMNCVDNIYVVYTATHYESGVSLQECIEDIHKNFPTVPYVTFNIEESYEKTKISKRIFFEQKYELIEKIFNNVVNKGLKYKGCKPFFKQELLYMASSILSPSAADKKCVFEGEKLSIVPTGEAFICVDNYYAKEEPIATVSEGKELLEKFKTYKLKDNDKSKNCQICSVRTVCRFCPKQKDLGKVCEENKKYYTMVLSYLKMIYSSSELVRYFVKYSEISDGILFVLYKYVRSYECDDR